jgi:RNA polymerase primary sigma factor
MQDYRVEIKVKNNRILTTMERAGYKSVAHLATALNVPRNGIDRIVKMKRAALDNDGYYTPIALKIAELLNCTPQDIYPAAQMRGTLAKNTAIIAVNEIDSLASSLKATALSPEKRMINNEAKNALNVVLLDLTPREHRILDLRFGLTNGQEAGYGEIGKQFGVCAQRIMQLEAKALRKMKHKTRAKKLREILDDMVDHD